jgi:hypothetical protein
METDHSKTTSVPPGLTMKTVYFTQVHCMDTTINKRSPTGHFSQKRKVSSVWFESNMRVKCKLILVIRTLNVNFYTLKLNKLRK